MTIFEKIGVVMGIDSAFYDTCHEAKEPESAYVSLYRKAQAYGGPEEGGWWRDIVSLEASQHCHTLERAEAVKAAVETLAEQETRNLKTAHGDMCNSQLGSCGWDGELAQHQYGEVDGPGEYFVVVESTKGSRAYATPAGYE